MMNEIPNWMYVVLIVAVAVVCIVYIVTRAMTKAGLVQVDIINLLTKQAETLQQLLTRQAVTYTAANGERERRGNLAATATE